jgi:cardiolipin synthase
MGLAGIPNLITLARLAAIPFISYFYLTHQYQWAFLILTCAGVSDLIDGGLARLLSARTKLGAILDPAADKTLMLVAFTTLAIAREIPVWFAAMVVLRDVYIVVGVLILKFKYKKIYIRPTYISKMTTFVQLSLLFARFASSYLETTAFSWSASALKFFSSAFWVSFFLTIIFTLASGIHYTLVGWALNRGKIYEVNS